MAIYVSHPGCHGSTRTPWNYCILAAEIIGQHGVALDSLDT